jgi:Glycosyltransferase family 87
MERGLGPHPLVDFDAFYLVGQMVWRGEIEKAYYFATMAQAQKDFTGSQSFMSWTYPPQFDLLVALLALLPLGVAYSLFTAGTLVAYLMTLRRLGGESFAPVLIVLFPAICITIACGQNGFLTATLIGLTCLGFQRRRALAGLPLGLMIIKPHLAIAFAVYTLVTRRWSTALVAIATVVTTSALATILLGPEVWLAFLGGMREARIFLEHGYYPLFRMISPYAALHSFGFPAMIAIAAQVLVAAFSLSVVCLAVYRRLEFRQSLGLTAIASLLISPYAYDYDLPIY